MIKNKLKIRIHNPNTDEETVRLITKFVARLASEKLYKVILDEEENVEAKGMIQ